LIGTDLKVIKPAALEVLGPDVNRVATLHTNARNDRELRKVWLKSHADGSPHAVPAYSRVGKRFIAALTAAGADLRKATVEDVQTPLEAMRSKADGSRSGRRRSICMSPPSNPSWGSRTASASPASTPRPSSS
jgi:hypothetical protein